MRSLYALMAVCVLTGATGCASIEKVVAQTREQTRPLVVDAAPATPLPPSFVQTKVLRMANLANDNVLESLLAQVPDSPDAAIADSRLREATARLQAARAGLLPSITSTTSVGAASSEGVAGSSSASLGSNLQVPIDLFGANRGRVSATAARAEEAAYNRDRTLALTRATLSQLYVSLRTAQAQIAVTQINIESATDSLSLATTRQRAGLETGLGVAQATSNRDAIAARLPGFQQSAVAAKLGIEAILGKLPDDLASQLEPVRPIPRFDLSRVNLPPDQWLNTRADLLAAARRLQAAGLEAGAAKRDRYPNVSLSGLLSQTGASRGPTGLAGSISANLLSTLFDFGRLDALAKAAGAVAETQAGLYRQLVLTALADVETQASRVTQGEAAIAANAANVASAQDQANLARVRYTSGLTTFLDVLTAQRAVYEAQSARVAATGETAAAEVALNLALGF
jgi:outer membrane protein, multidrug efflux system